jgi:hypothetical protein
VDKTKTEWDFYHYFQSAEYSQHFLKKCYEKKQITEAETKSYDNCYPFLYYLEQGELYYQQAAQCPLSLKPIMLFYGFIQLIKAVILTEDPFYPETTSVLAHGVTARKRKKQNYRFLNDEVKIQKNGLFSHSSQKLFNIKQLSGEKFTMHELLLQIPEMEESFQILFQKPTLIWFDHNQQLTVSEQALQHFHMSKDLFKEYLNELLGNNIEWVNDDTLQVKGKKEVPPLRYHQKEGRLALPYTRTATRSYPEVLIHYAILYNLSMIARYETEWWMELLKNHSNEDYPLIYSFIEITTSKTPTFILDMLKTRI